MDEDSIPQRPESDRSAHSESTSNVRFKSPDGTEFDISSHGGNLGNHVMIGIGQTMVVNKNSGTRKRHKAKKPLTENSEEPKSHLLQKIAQKLLMEEAIMVGRELSLSDAKIDEIKVDYNTDGTAEIKYRILAEWVKQDVNPTIAAIAIALNSIERGDIADKLPR